MRTSQLKLLLCVMVQGAFYSVNEFRQKLSIGNNPISSCKNELTANLM